MAVADMARADIALTPERIYYRFATDESIEDGELPAAKEDFGALAAKILSSAEARADESPLGDGVKVTVFVDNRVTDIKFSEQSLKRMVSDLRNIAEEFAFLAGFVR